MSREEKSRLIEMLEKGMESRSAKERAGGYIRVSDDMMDLIIEQLKGPKPAKKEWEGGGGSWFAVCEDCRGQVGEYDAYCRHCGRALEDE